jgi:hypothetical protein
MSTKKTGFTIIELLLAMTFLALLLIGITLLIIRITAIYQKGLTVRAINTTGRVLIDDFTRTVSGSPIVNVSFAEDENAAGKVKDYFFENLNEAGVQMSGGFCTGAFSYIWNTAYAIKDDNRLISYNGSSDFRLIKVPDPERQICAQHMSLTLPVSDLKTISFPCPDIGSTSYQIPIKVDGRYVGQPLDEQTTFLPPSGWCDQPTELLANSNDGLTLYNFRVFPASSNQITGHIFYTATFILATLRGDVNIYAPGDYCQDIPDNLDTDFSYCAINKFNFAMRATGETKNEEEEYGKR